jgi:hypothetical protein
VVLCGPRSTNNARVMGCKWDMANELQKESSDVTTVTNEAASRGELRRI